MLGKQDQKRAEMRGDEEEEKEREKEKGGAEVQTEQTLGEKETSFLHRWRNANRWWRYARV